MVSILDLLIAIIYLYILGQYITAAGFCLTESESGFETRDFIGHASAA